MPDDATTDDASRAVDADEAIRWLGVLCMAGVIVTVLCLPNLSHPTERLAIAILYAPAFVAAFPLKGLGFLFGLETDSPLLMIPAMVVLVGYYAWVFLLGRLCLRRPGWTFMRFLRLFLWTHAACLAVTVPFYYL